MAGSRILIVEDERLVAEDIRLTLESLGYKIAAVVHTGEDAIDKAAETKPDLVLMDITLGAGIDGIEAASRIRRVSDIPVIYLTAYAEHCTRERTQASEPFGYLVKPFKTADLRCAIDIALYKHKCETLLRASEDKFRRFYNDAPWAYHSLDSSGRLVEINAAWTKVVGYSREEILGKWFGDLLIPEDQQPFRSSFEGMAETGEIHDVEQTMVTKDGSTITVNIHSKVIRDKEGRFQQTHAILYDITDKKATTQASERTGARLERAMATMADGIFVLDSNLVFTYVNSAACEAFKSDGADLVGQFLRETVAGIDGTAFARSLEKALKDNTPVSFEAHFGDKGAGASYAVRVCPVEQGLCVYFQTKVAE